MKPVLTKLEPTSPKQRDLLSTQRSPPSWKYWHSNLSTWHKSSLFNKTTQWIVLKRRYPVDNTLITKHCLLDVTRPVRTRLCSRLLRRIDPIWVPFDSCHWRDPLGNPKQLQMHGHALGPGTNVAGGQIVAIGLCESLADGNHRRQHNTQTYFSDSQRR